MVPLGQAAARGGGGGAGGLEFKGIEQHGVRVSPDPYPTLNPKLRYKLASSPGTDPCNYLVHSLFWEGA